MGNVVWKPRPAIAVGRVTRDRFPGNGAVEIGLAAGFCRNVHLSAAWFGRGSSDVSAFQA
jgi:hypothetical protein